MTFPDLSFGNTSAPRVLITGHSGFIGSWLAWTLIESGARVYGLSLREPVSTPSHCGVTDLDAHMEKVYVGTIDDAGFCQQVVDEVRPHYVFHLAAQPLVALAAKDPLGTWRTNVQGTANVLEALRGAEDLTACVCFTTDKVYRNNDRGRHFVEDDPLGGYEPYGASKAAAELVIEQYRNVFANRDPGVPLASVRAGNVVGGGDWGDARIIPDAVRAWTQGGTLQIASPDAIRPWQHVLDVVRACCDVAVALNARHPKARDVQEPIWNIGPYEATTTVQALIETLRHGWPCSTPVEIAAQQGRGYAEAVLLRLDPARVAKDLGWQTRLGIDALAALTREWYIAYLQSPASAGVETRRQIEAYFTSGPN